MHVIIKVSLTILAALIGYIAGALGGGFLVSALSSNRHDRSIEAAMAGAFIIGPIVAIIAVFIALWFLIDH